MGNKKKEITTQIENEPQVVLNDKLPALEELNFQVEGAHYHQPGGKQIHKHSPVEQTFKGWKITEYRGKDCVTRELVYYLPCSHRPQQDYNVFPKIISIAHKSGKSCVILEDEQKNYYLYTLDQSLYYKDVCSLSDFSGPYGGATCLTVREKVEFQDNKTLYLKYVVTVDGAVLRPGGREDNFTTKKYLYLDPDYSFYAHNACELDEVTLIDQDTESKKKPFELFNLIWDAEAGHPAVILYPALMTPEIVWENELLELILLVKDGQELTQESVNRHLKFVYGINPKKRIREKPLFENGVYQHKISICDISIENQLDEPLQNMEPVYLKCNTGRFSGILDKRALREYQTPRSLTSQEYWAIYNELEQYYSSSLSRKQWDFKKSYKKLGNGMYVLKEDISPKVKQKLKKIIEKVKNIEFNRFYLIKIEVDWKFFEQRIKDSNQDVIPAAYDREIQDKYLKSILLEFNGEKIAGRGTCCFKMDSQDLNINESDSSNPIQSYHPVFYYKKPAKYLNIGHLADPHISARQLLLRRSDARVIENETCSTSPPIGKMLNTNSMNFKEVLDKYGEQDIDIVLISGDLIDHIRNTCVDTDMKLHEIWKAVEIEAWGDNEGRYEAFVDNIIFYSLIIYFYKKYKKPVFVVSGNHDAYYDPYGISPRVFSLFRANEGIPADHNLTFYESMLIFGKTYKEVYELKSGIKEEMFEWFYTILTPFSDFVQKLPNQVLLGLGWGDDERFFRLNDDQGNGFLPRAIEAVSDLQKKLVNYTKTQYANEKKIIMSHFTFASFAENIAFEENPAGIIHFNQEYSKHDMGTFELNRDIIKTLDQFQLILSGHSHRRALYSLNCTNSDVDHTNGEVTAYSFKDYIVKHEELCGKQPLIVVSDSIGPHPRYNKSGEFFGWGSDRPSGTKISFNELGDVRSIETCKVGNKPRFIIAVDYEDILIDSVFYFQTESVNKNDDDNGTVGGYRFRFALKKYLSTIVDVESISIHSMGSTGAWSVITLQKGEMEEVKIESFLNQKWHNGNTVNGDTIDTILWNIDKSENVLFRNMEQNKERAHFMSIKFLPTQDWIKEQYDFSSHWNFEFQIGKHEDGDDRTYFIIRNKKYAEKPDFDWRKDNINKYLFPEITNGFWTKSKYSDSKISKAFFNQIVGVCVHTNNLANDKEVRLVIYERDCFLNPNDKVCEVSSKVFNDRVNYDIELTPDFYTETGKEGDSCFIFEAVTTVGSEQIEKKLPYNEKDWLIVKKPAFLDGYWADCERKKQKKININSSPYIFIYIKTENIIPHEKLEVSIYNGEDEVKLITNCENVNNEIFVELDLSKLTKQERDKELSFKVIYPGFEDIDAEFPKDDDDYLLVKEQ